MLYAMFGRNCPVVLERKIFYIRHFVIIPQSKKVWASISRNLSPLYSRMLCAKYSWNWPSNSGEDENVNSLQTEGQTDGRQAIRKAHLSCQLRWAKKPTTTKQTRPWAKLLNCKPPEHFLVCNKLEQNYDHARMLVESKKEKSIHYPLFTWTEISSDFACRPSFVCPSVSLSINFSHFISLGNY